MAHIDDTHSHRHDPFDDDDKSGLPWKLIGLLVVVIALATFFLQNSQRIDVNFLWFDGSLPLWTVIAICVALGVVLDRLVTWQWRRARSRRHTEH